MPNKRDLNLDKYNISQFRYRELKYFCLQYEEWKTELNNNIDAVKSTQITDMPSSHAIGDSTCNLAVRRVELFRNCELIEQMAIKADCGIYQSIIKNVTQGIAFEYMDAYCGRRQFYLARNKFFYLLSKIKV